MNRRNFLLTGLGTCLAGCRAPGQFGLVGMIGSPKVVEPREVPIKYSSIENMQYDFDDAFEIARRIQYKSEPPFSDHMQSPEETLRLGTGDCEDFAVYLSKLLTDKRISNEVVFGQVQRADGLNLHVWNRVYEGGHKYLLDAVAGTRLLEEEIPVGYYREYLSVKFKGFSPLVVAGYNLKTHLEEIPPVFRNLITGDPKKRIIGGGKVK
jgi:hypothetical protein